MAQIPTMSSPKVGPPTVRLDEGSVQIWKTRQLRGGLFTPSLSAAIATLALVFGVFGPTRASADLSTSFKGSSLSVKNVVSTLSLNKDGQLTYNPYYAVSVQASPRFWFTGSFYTSVSVGAVRNATFKYLVLYHKISI